MTLTRRGFFGTIAAAYVARFAPLPLPTPQRLIYLDNAGSPLSGAVGGISPASFTFWRNRQNSIHSTIEWMERAEAPLYFFDGNGAHVVGPDGAQSLVT